MKSLVRGIDEFSGKSAIVGEEKKKGGGCNGSGQG